MIGFQIKDGFLDFAKTDFDCPYCKKKHVDANDKYLNRCNKNKSGLTKVKCDCEKTFYLTYDYRGDFVTFKSINKLNNDRIY
jgi:hypothetical protein